MTTEEEIVDLIRGGISRADAVALVEQYGKAKAADAACLSTAEAWGRAIATLAQSPAQGNTP